MVWDGDQILHEISAPGWTGAGALMQRDTGLVVPATYINTTSDARRISFPKQAYRGFFYGRVMYTHGGGIDKPLSLTRMEYSDSLYSPATIFPTADWRGSYDYGVGIPCRQILVQKRLLSQHTEPGLPDTVPTTYENHCYDIDWPAPHVLITRVRKDKDYLGETSWMGSLLNEQRDASGQMYRRNRYYDPQSGRFTQEDPIGIAGGLNVYGYANGDPIGYSDPYGLSPTSCLPVCLLPFAPSPTYLRATAALAEMAPAAVRTLGAGVGTAATVVAASLMLSGDTCPSCDEDRRSRMAVYHRAAGPEETTQVLTSGEVWGRAPRNTFASDRPKVKAYSGPLPPGVKGYEFVTHAEPDRGHVPGKPTWSGNRAGVRTDDDWAKINAQVTKVQQ